MQHTLLSAAKDGKVSEVQSLMDCPNLKINQGDHEGKTALYLAAENNRTQVVVELLEDSGVDVNKGKKEESCQVPLAECNYGAPPLFIASRYGHEAVVKALLADSRLDPNIGLKNSNATPLFVASQNGHTNVVKALLSHDRIDPNRPFSGFYDSGYSPLYIASQNGHTNVVRALLSHDKVDPNMRTSVNGFTPLMKATGKVKAKRQMRYLEIVRLLLQCPKTDHTLKSTGGCRCDVLTAARRYGLGLVLSAIENRSSLLEGGKTC